MSKIKQYKKSNKQQEYTLELVLANGKSRKFKSGYDMWKWATNTTQWKFETKYKN